MKHFMTFVLPIIILIAGCKLSTAGNSRTKSEDKATFSVALSFIGGKLVYKPSSDDPALHSWEGSVVATSPALTQSPSGEVTSSDAVKVTFKVKIDQDPKALNCTSEPFSLKDTKASFTCDGPFEEVIRPIPPNQDEKPDTASKICTCVGTTNTSAGSIQEEFKFEDSAEKDCNALNKTSKMFGKFTYVLSSCTMKAQDDSNPDDDIRPIPPTKPNEPVKPNEPTKPTEPTKPITPTPPVATKRSCTCSAINKSIANAPTVSKIFSIDVSNQCTSLNNSYQTIDSNRFVVYSCK